MEEDEYDEEDDLSDSGGSSFDATLNNGEMTSTIDPGGKRRKRTRGGSGIGGGPTTESR
jgi:hypothetical protein